MTATAAASPWTRTPPSGACCAPPSTTPARARGHTYTLLVPNDEGELEEITLTATCEGPRSDNDFYGEGIVNALRAVRR